MPLLKLANNYEGYSFLKQAEEVEKPKPSNEKAVAGAGLLGGGVVGASKQRGKIDGIERLLHGTDIAGSEGIRQTGIRASKAGEGSATKMSNLESRVGADSLKGKTYVTNNRGIARNVALKQALNPENNDMDPSKLLDNVKRSFKTSRIEKVNVPLRDFQTGRLQEVANPELRGMNKKDFVDNIFKEMHGGGEELPNPIKNAIKKQYGKAYTGLDSPTTRTVQGDIGAKYIKNSPHYQGGQTLKGFSDYVRHNPKRFATGAGLAGLGGASALVGGKLLKDEYDIRKG